MDEVECLDLKKAYNKIARVALWSVLRMYKVKGKLERERKSFYEESEASVRIGRKK